MSNRNGIILAIALLVVAALVFGRYLWASHAESATQSAMSAADVEKRIGEIQNDPHMPPEAKAIAIGQLRAHMSEGPQGGAPAAPSPSGR